MPSPPHHQRILPALLASSALSILALLLPAAGAATTYVMMPDAALVEQADLIAQVTVEVVEPAPIAGPPATDSFVQIERILKGHATGSTIVVRVPGGIGPDGTGLRIRGVPDFRPGERLLLFLAPRGDGTYGVLHLMLGAFYEVEAGGLRVAVRALSEALELPGTAIDGLEPLRDFGGFVNWITDRATGLERPIDYYLDPAAGFQQPVAESPRLLEDPCTQLNLRWFDFDRGESVPWSLDGRDLSGRGRQALAGARRIWNRGTGGAVRLSDGGEGGDASGLTAFDGVNALLFDDPADDVSGRFACRTGGVVALTGVWYENGRGQSCERTGAGRKGSWQGRRYLEILGADILTNDGSACLLAGDVFLASRILAHELGHSLGLSHSAVSDSLMWALVRGGDGRAELPHREDLEALGALYDAQLP